MTCEAESQMESCCEARELRESFILDLSSSSSPSLVLPAPTRCPPVDRGIRSVYRVFVRPLLYSTISLHIPGGPRTWDSPRHSGSATSHLLVPSSLADEVATSLVYL